MNPLIATVIILVLTIAALLTEKLSFVAISPFIIVSLILTGVLSPTEALSGFSNTNVVMFVAMFIVGGALVKTSLLDRMQKIVAKYKNKPNMLVAISCIVSGIISLVTSQTACAVIMLPLLVGIANEIGFSRSRLLYPAIAVAGGTIPFKIWDFAIGRLPILIVTFVYMVTIGHRLLPDIPNEQFADYKETQKTKTSLALSPVKEKLALVICSLTIIAMFLADFINVPLYIFAVSGATLLIITGVLSEKEALNSIHWPTVFLFAGVLPLSTALQKSGAGDLVAEFMIKLLGNTTNPYVIVFFFILIPLILRSLCPIWPPSQFLYRWQVPLRLKSE